MSTLRNKPNQPRDDEALVFIGIPEEILFRILARLPMKDLLKVRCVCEFLKTLIDGPAFNDAYLQSSSMNTSHDCLHIQTRSHEKLLSLFCANTFTQLSEQELPTNNVRSEFCIVGSYNGVFCIRDDRYGIYLWNPSIKKFKILPESLIGRSETSADVGFGFDPQSSDYIVVRIWSYVDPNVKTRRCRDRRKTEVEVYNHRSETWRRIDATPATSQARFVYIIQEGACVDGVMYWLMYESSPYGLSILSFNLSSEIFRNITLPVVPETCRLHFDPSSYEVGIRVFEKSLSLFHGRQEEKHQYCDVWILKRDSWKLSRMILLPAGGTIAWPLGFASNDRLHVVMKSGEFYQPKLFSYDTESQQVEDVGIVLNWYPGSRYIDYVRESLVLLN